MEKLILLISPLCEKVLGRDLPPSARVQKGFTTEGASNGFSRAPPGVYMQDDPSYSNGGSRALPLPRVPPLSGRARISPKGGVHGFLKGGCWIFDVGFISC